MTRVRDLWLLAVVGAAGCGGRAAATGEPGAPLPGLGPVERERFRAGAEVFNRVFRPAEGLGPAFNENQCSACHTSPAVGGVGGERVLKATRFDRATGCNQLTETGGENIRRQLTPQARALGLKAESPPPAATTGRFTAPELYGLGLVDAVSDAALLELQERERAHHDGVAGRLGRTADGRVGRFGRKADVATLAEFAATARAWLEGWEVNAEELSALDVPGAFEERKRDRQVLLRAIDDGLLRRGLFSATSRRATS